MVRGQTSYLLPQLVSLTAGWDSPTSDLRPLVCVKFLPLLWLPSPPLTPVEFAPFFSCPSVAAILKSSGQFVKINWTLSWLSLETHRNVSASKQDSYGEDSHEKADLWQGRTDPPQPRKKRCLVRGSRDGNNLFCLLFHPLPISLLFSLTLKEAPPPMTAEPLLPPELISVCGTFLV